MTLLRSTVAQNDRYLRIILGCGGIFVIRSIGGAIKLTRQKSHILVVLLTKHRLQEMIQRLLGHTTTKDKLYAQQGQS